VIFMSLRAIDLRMRSRLCIIYNLTLSMMRVIDLDSKELLQCLKEVIVALILINKIDRIVATWVSAFRILEPGFIRAF
jgi:hypothetical protein